MSLGKSQGSSLRCLHTSSTVANRAQGIALGSAFFVSACGSCRPQAKDRVPGVGERGDLWERLSPECHPLSRCSPRTQDTRSAPGAVLTSCPVLGARDPVAPVSPGTLPHRLCWLLQWLSTPQSPPVPILRAHLQAAQPSRAATHPPPSPGAEPAAPPPQPWLHISCLEKTDAPRVP